MTAAFDPGRSPRFRDYPTLLFCIGAPALAALWVAWVGHAYVDLSEGVYLLTGRELLHGQTLYQSVVAAHPPGVYLAAAAVLSIDGSIVAARLVLAAVAVVQAGLVATLTERLTGGRWVVAVTGLASLVGPWALRGRTFTPEAFVAPLLLGAVLLGRRRSAVLVAGLLGAVAVFFKVPYVFPAGAMALTTVNPRRSVAAFAAGLVAFAAVCFVVFGTAFSTNVILAQIRIGTARPRLMLGLWRLAFYEAAPLLIVAGLGWWLARQTAEHALSRALGATCLVSLSLTLTVVKYGTGIVNLAVVEPLALPLAAVAAMRLRHIGAAARPAAAVVVMVAGVWTLAQSASLFVSPLHPIVSYDGNSWEANGRQVSLLLDSARACDPRRPYSGDAYIAFLAGRRAPGGQPDAFILGSPVHEDIRRRVDADRPRCP